MTLHNLRIVYITIREVSNSVVMMCLVKNICKSQIIWKLCHKNAMHAIVRRLQGTGKREFVHSTSANDVSKSRYFFAATPSLTR